MKKTSTIKGKTRRVNELKGESYHIGVDLEGKLIS